MKQIVIVLLVFLGQAISQDNLNLSQISNSGDLTINQNDENKANEFQTKLFKFLEEQIKEATEADFEFIKNELMGYINSYPQNELVPSAYFHLANLYKNVDYKRRLAILFKLRMVYPDFKTEDVKVGITEIVFDKEKEYYQKKQNDLLFAVASTYKTENREENYFAFINFIYKLSDVAHSEILIWEGLNFVKEFNSSVKNTEIYFFIADNYKRIGKHNDALGSFQKLNHMFPQNVNYVKSLYEQATLYRYHLNKIGHALKIFEMIVKSHAKTNEAGYAQYEIAKIEDEIYKSNLTAIKEYEKFIYNYYTNPNLLTAVERLATIQVDRYSFKKIVNYLVFFVEKNPTHEKSIPSLRKALNIVKVDLKDQNMFIDLSLMYAKYFPKDDDAQKFLYEAGLVAKNQMKNRDKALELFEKIYREYPSSKTGEDALTMIQEIKRTMF